MIGVDHCLSTQTGTHLHKEKIHKHTLGWHIAQGTVHWRQRAGSCLIPVPLLQTNSKHSSTPAAPTPILPFSLSLLPALLFKRGNSCWDMNHEGERHLISLLNQLRVRELGHRGWLYLHKHLTLVDLCLYLSVFVKHFKKRNKSGHLWQHCCRL